MISGLQLNNLFLNMVPTNVDFFQGKSGAYGLNARNDDEQ